MEKVEKVISRLDDFDFTKIWAIDKRDNEIIIDFFDVDSIQKAIERVGISEVLSSFAGAMDYFRDLVKEDLLDIYKKV